MFKNRKAVTRIVSKMAGFYICCFCCLFSSAAFAEEISAVDFNGNLIGKVIPDGSVVGVNNQLIGNVTADSLIVNFDGKIIGGVVPQGVAIGNDTKILGKVNNDGSVRLASGKVVGKALPNGLVLNTEQEIIGAVLFPGLIYSDKGETIGRLTGDGAYTNLKGQQVGFVSPSGYAYRKVGTEYLLDGKLISSKMVVSDKGAFIGSVNPGGQVSNFEGEVIGQVRANGFVYNEQQKIIGRIVRSGYAFDNYGKYLGFVSYNGEVIKGEDVVGRQSADGKIKDDKGNTIGYMVDFDAAATDLKGKYLGRLLPEGQISAHNEVIGTLGPKGIVLDKEGKITGRIVVPGSVFDYKGTLKGIALNNGRVISMDGSRIGYAKGKLAYTNDNKPLGGVLESVLAIGPENNSLGVTSIGSKIGDEWIVSPLGYVFDAAGAVKGMIQKMGAVYGMNGAVVGELTPQGEVKSSGGATLGKIMQNGINLDERNRLLGKTIDADFVTDTDGNNLGNLAANNFVLNDKQEIIAKILPDSALVKTSSDNSPELMPVAGWAYGLLPAVSIDGEFLGYAEADGVVRKDGNKVGKVVEFGNVVDNSNILIGKIINYGSAVNETCQTQGVLTPDARIRNFREVNLGRVLANAQVIDNDGNVISRLNKLGALRDNDGNVIGITSMDGQALNYNNENLGCVDYKGYLRNASGEIIGAQIAYMPVMGLDDKIIGRIMLDGRVVDDDNQFIGYAQARGGVNSKTGNPLGIVFRYQVAFDNGNHYLGRINSKAEVLDSQNKVIGIVDHEGYVWFENKKIGYALYDFYVYDKDFKTVGYIDKNGEIFNFNNKSLGRLRRGFLVGAEGKVIARGNRDYLLRNENNAVYGELALDGTVYNLQNKPLGKINELGHLLNDGKEIVAAANALQFYNPGSYQIVVDDEGKFLGYINENGELIDEKGNVIGHKNKEGQIVDKDNKVIGKVPEKEKAYDTAGNFVGYVNPDGTVENEDGKIIGTLDKDGTVRDASGNILGGIGNSWYEKAPEARSQKGKSEVGDGSNIKVGSIEAIVPSEGMYDKDGQYRKSLNIALTPNGEYLGDILVDGRVVDKKGNVLGRKMPDGLIIDDSGSLIGIEEVKKNKDNEIFVPAGEFGPGAAYGIGRGPGTNLGPGGGFGPGERYDPQRQYALGVAMSERRKNISVGQLSSSYDRESFDGMQKNWKEQGIDQVISSWRVDMSEMILADKPIPAVIARSIDSNNPTPVTAIVERNVFSEQGRNILIPAGSRLIGTLSSFTTDGEMTSTSAKIQISWQRLIRPDGSIFVFDGLTGDAQGRGGALGYLDQQLFKRYSLPIMMTVLTSATAYYMADDDDENNGEVESSRQEAASDARQNFLNKMDEVFNQILNDKASIRPMTYVPAGTRIIVYPQVDLWLRTEERAQDAKNMIYGDDMPLQVDTDNEREFNRRNRPQPTSSNVKYKNNPTGAVEESGENNSVPLMVDTKPAKKNVYTPPKYYRPPVQNNSGAQNRVVQSGSNTNNTPKPPINNSTNNKTNSEETNAGVPQLF